jgi:sugar lactone lactonase YvrE
MRLRPSLTARAATGALLLALGLAPTGCSAPPRRVLPPALEGATIILKGVGFATPESVLHDQLTDLYYVSNINGNEIAKDDNGFISLVSPAGKVLALKWIDGAADSVTLNAPKGMGVTGGYLYVADIDVVRRFDRRTGGPRGEIPIPGATFLNDIAATEDGSVYVTDSGLRAGASGLEPSGTDAVYRIRPDGRLDTLARGEALGHPNGIAISGDSVWVVSYGSGELYRVAGGKKTDVQKLPKGGLDGLVLFAGQAYVSSWEGGSIFRGKVGGPLTEILNGLDAPADIGHDLWRDKLLIPLFNRNEVHIVPLAL